MSPIFIRFSWNLGESTEIENAVHQYSSRVASGISDLSKCAYKLREAGWEDPNDPNVVATKELFNAAAAIEEAALKLSQLKPRKEASSKVDTNLNFDEQIISAAQAIAKATKLLVQSASSAQKELVQQGRLTKTDSNDSYHAGTFRDGLVSAAKLVAASTGSMCEAANGLVTGESGEDRYYIIENFNLKILYQLFRLEASAKQVSTATTKLIIACQGKISSDSILIIKMWNIKVKADVNSESVKRLKMAGNAVKQASNSLIDAAKSAQDANTYSVMK